MPGDLERDIDAGSSEHHPIRTLLRRCRAWVERHPALRIAYLVAVAVAGTLIIAVGVLLIPLPGPGWLIVFLGLAVLGTEFAGARRLGALVKRFLRRVWVWWRARRVARAQAAFDRRE
ncbi:MULTISPECIES: PGPGW domain-containing protein [unclassified Salinibacterium]|uniref:PGPGW domain-containing protein n=1 Tax=unclassified Salinibacterium TaxID=2632331 RepID=UPI00141F8B77|nr:MULTISPECIES: PGPGW domain-containing protein [unclassified Salinibacterium]